MSQRRIYKHLKKVGLLQYKEEETKTFEITLNEFEQMSAIEQRSILFRLRNNGHYDVLQRLSHHVKKFRA